jgi:OFA family oxalate/formate antiporter-like MFS transporter
MIALAWVLNSYADSLPCSTPAAVIGGIGAGAVYGTCVGNALKWFPDRRGLAAGATAAGFGAGAAADRGSDRQHDCGERLPEGVPRCSGIGQGLIVLLLSPSSSSRPPS